MADPPDGGFLPPQAPGPEPELGKAPTPPPPPPALPPNQPPPAQWGQPAPGAWQQQPPGWQPPPGQQQPPQQQWQQQPPPPQQGWQQPQWAYPSEPDNGPAVTGFVLAMVSLALWVFTAGLSTLVSLGLAIAGLFVSRTGKRRVASGQTRKNKGLAQAGFISSIVMIVLALLSTVAWTVFFVLLATDEDFRDDFDDENGGFDSNSITTTVRLGALVVRVGAHLLS
jgi:hypothetical protein